MSLEKYKKDFAETMFIENIENPKFKTFFSLEREEQINTLRKDLSLLIEKEPYSGNYLLHLAILKKDYDLVEEVINIGGDVNVDNANKQTGLHLLMYDIHNSTINFLLEQNADTNKRDINGNTPLHLAAAKNAYKIIKLLLLFKADVTIKNYEGDLPINIAQKMGFIKSVEALLEKTQEKLKMDFKLNQGNSSNSSKNLPACSTIFQTSPGGTNPGIINYNLNNRGQMQNMNYGNAYGGNVYKVKGGHRSLYSYNFFPQMGIQLNTDEYNSNDSQKERNTQLTQSPSINPNYSELKVPYSENKPSALKIDCNFDTPSPDKSSIYVRKKSSSLHEKNYSVQYNYADLANKYQMDINQNPPPTNAIYQKKRIQPMKKKFKNITISPCNKNIKGNFISKTSPNNSNPNYPNEKKNLQIRLNSDESGTQDSPKKVYFNANKNNIYNFNSNANKNSIDTIEERQSSEMSHFLNNQQPVINSTEIADSMIITNEEMKNSLPWRITEDNRVVLKVDESKEEDTLLSMEKEDEDKFKELDNYLIKSTFPLEEIKSETNDININIIREIEDRIETIGRALSKGGCGLENLDLRKTLPRIKRNKNLTESKNLLETKKDDFKQKDIQETLKAMFYFDKTSIDEKIKIMKDDEDSSDEIIENFDPEEEAADCALFTKKTVKENTEIENEDDDFQIVEPNKETTKETNKYLQTTIKDNNLNLKVPENYKNMALFNSRLSLDLNSTIKKAMENQTVTTLKDPLFSFLKTINMEDYTDKLFNNGFDDIDLIMKQMKSGYGITESNLKELGITKAGDRAKILIRLQELSNVFAFEIDFDAVYHLNKKPFETQKIYDLYAPQIKKTLRQLDLLQYLKNFYDHGYHSMELIYVQMYSMYPFDEKILEEIGIEKIAHRALIMNKLKEQGYKYIQEMIKKKKGKEEPEKSTCNIY
ncbi:MAG: ankyrin repeat domain-containing protein [archaeon]|nr:ankyrin repeat domain-containing protein [archaeon]